MITTIKLSRFLNSYMDMKVEDYSRNGLQVHGTKHITKIGFCVDACLESFRLARKAGCDCIIAHHGIYWKGAKDLTGLVKRREKYLSEHKMSLYGIHLPLDLHHEVGNNIEIARFLGLSGIEDFGRHHGFSIGYSGIFNSDLKSLVDKIRKISKPVVLDFGRKRVKRVGIVSGGGSRTIHEAYLEGIDCVITGEAPHQVYHEAKEYKLNVILAGHYETEVFGVKALGKVIKEKFNIPCQFIDVPTEI
ncbi:MAG: Nif3-like dinuclear metal center hexameric protein [Candidatus Woesearchaeota archaeon]